MNQHLLVVDDDEGVRSFLVCALRESGYAVSAAPEGTSALKLIGERDFDLILIDFALPGMTGADLVQRIREGRAGQKMLLISGYAGTEALQRAAGNVPLVAKPVTVRDLLAAVKAVLDDRSAGLAEAG
jgi:DNA-binding response OmpR family regulator